MDPQEQTSPNINESSYSPPPTPHHQQHNQQQSFHKLICSFKSELPNEIDFGMQVATILANSDNFTWSSDYPIVDAMCSSLHVYSCVCDEESACCCYPRFWRKLLTKNANNPYLIAAAAPPDIDQRFINFHLLEDHDLKDHSKIHGRIKKVAELIMQFSMTTSLPKAEKNGRTIYDYSHQMKKKKPKASPPLLKFVSLLLHCDDMSLNLIGLTILSNTASKLSKVSDESDSQQICTKLVQMFQDFLIDCIMRPDGDIHLINRSIEALSQLISSSRKRVSSHVVNMIVEKNLVQRIEQFLTCQYDVSLFLSALECFYRISRHQPNLLSNGRTSYIVKLLVHLLNCDETQYFKPSALKKIKLVDDEDRVYHLTSLNQNDKNSTEREIHLSTLQVAPTISDPATNSSLNSTPIPAKNLVKSSSVISEPTKTSATVLPQIPNGTSPVVPTTTSNTASTTSPNTITTSSTNSSSIPEAVATTVAPAATTITTTTTTTSTSAVPNSISAASTTPTPAATPALVETATSMTTATPASNNNSTTKTNNATPQVAAIKASVQEPDLQYSCEWDECGKKFAEAKNVYNHVFEAHVGPIESGALTPCLWSGPNGSGPGCLTKRPKYSLLTHLNDFHCNPAALGRAFNRSQPIKPPEHPGYAPNAALQAIKRHANAQLDILHGTKSPQTRSPLSVSVRLTAALILRNLATESSEMKEALENHEPLLSEICMSNERDEAKIIAECLSLFSNE